MKEILNQFLQLEARDMFTVVISLINIITTIVLVLVNQSFLQKNKKSDYKRQIFVNRYRPVLDVVVNIESLWSRATELYPQFNLYNPQSGLEQDLAKSIMAELETLIKLDGSSPQEYYDEDVDRILYSINTQTKCALELREFNQKLGEPDGLAKNQFKIEDIRTLKKFILEFWHTLYQS